MKLMKSLPVKGLKKYTTAMDIQGILHFSEGLFPVG